MEAGEHAESKPLFEQMLNCPSLPDAMLNWAHKRLGFLCLYFEKDFFQAQKYFQSALRTNENDKECWSALGEAYQRQGAVEQQQQQKKKRKEKKRKKNKRKKRKKKKKKKIKKKKRKKKERKGKKRKNRKGYEMK